MRISDWSSDVCSSDLRIWCDIRRGSSWAHPDRKFEVAAGDVDELRVVPRRPNRKGMADRPEGKAGDPEPKAKPDRAGEGGVDDRKAARRAAEQDRVGEPAVHRRAATRNVGLPCNQTSAPPPPEKKERK